MATSNSTDFNQTRNEIINDAYQLLGVYGVGRTISAEDLQFASRSLNRMVKAWQAQGLHLWTKEEAILFPSADPNVERYQLGNTASDAHCALRTDAVITELGAAEAAAQTEITVDSSTGMAANDAIGIELDDETVHWTTISSVDNATTLTIADALPSAAAANRNVYTYTNRINKPLRVLSVRRKVEVGDSSTSIPIVALSHQEYFDLAGKKTDGLSSHYYYNPDLSNGSLYLYPRPENGRLYFELTFERMIEDFDAAGDNPDFPSEWLECMVYQLATKIAPAFGKEEKAMAYIAPIASQLLQNMLDWDTEIEHIQLMPEDR